ncbi:hypothetical protein D3C81_358460 [compost metagenome]
MSTKPRFVDKRALFDDRKFNFGDVWIVTDEFVTMPQADHTGTRKRHNERWVVVTSNNEENFHPLCPIITVAPLSHQIQLLKKFDLMLKKENDSVNVDSLLQIKLMQPLLKKDLKEYKGAISEDRKIDLQVLIEDFFGLQD